MTSELKLALKSWPQWKANLSSQPGQSALLKGGLTNRSYLVKSDSMKFVVRLNNSKSANLGIDRETEGKILRTLGPLHISQKLIFSCPNYSFTVLEYIEGRVWGELDLLRADNRRGLRQVMHRVQYADIDIPEFNYLRHYERYWRLFKIKRPQEARTNLGDWKKFIQRLKLYQNNRQHRAIVHHDLTAKNIIETSAGLRIIDWEYAGLGFAELDVYAIAPDARKRLFSSSDHVKKKDMVGQMAYWLNFLWWKIR